MNETRRKAIELAIEIANDDSHGYDQIERWGVDYDCSSLVITCYANAGTSVKDNGATYTGNMLSSFKKSGFKDVTSSVNLENGDGLLPGDVLLQPKKHTVIYIGDGNVVSASINEKGTTTGGAKGDQTGREILVRPYYNFPWNYVLRFGEDEEASPDHDEIVESGVEVYFVKAGDTLSRIAADFGTTVNALVELNHIENPDLIIIGDKLLIPEKKEAPAPKTRTFTARVTTVKDPLRIRKTPNGAIVGYLAKDSTAEFEDHNYNSWYKLTDGRGYCHGNFLTRL